MDKLHFLFWGAGAIGTYIGGSLAQAGHQVAFVEQPTIAQELRRTGLRLDLGIDSRRNEQKVFYIESPAVHFEPSLEFALERGTFDVAIFALKSFDTASALEDLKPFADRLPPILCLQNGVDNEPLIAATLGADKVIAGTVTSAIGRNAAGNVVLEKLRGVGIAAGHPLSEKIVAAFNDGFLNAELFPVAADMKWSKMLTNILANASSAILDMTAHEIFKVPALYHMEIRMLQEALAVMDAMDTKVVDLPGTPVKQLRMAAKYPEFLTRPFMVQGVGKGRGGKMPSFHIDLHMGRGRSEVSYLNGAIVREGEKRGIRTPVNKMLTEILLGLTSGEIMLDAYSEDPDKLLARLKEYEQ